MLAAQQKKKKKLHSCARGKKLCITCIAMYLYEVSGNPTLHDEYAVVHWIKNISKHLIHQWKPRWIVA